MVCPVCSNPLVKMSTRSDYGANLFLNRCSHCGGLWLEGLTLYQVPREEVERIESLPKESGAKRSSAVPLTCPMCSIRLIPLKDSNLPPDISIERCEDCKGIWTDSGELTAYKTYQDKRKQFSKVARLKYELSKEESVAFLFVLFLLVVLPASVFLAKKGAAPVGKARQMQEGVRIEKVTTSQVTSSSALVSWNTSRKATSQVTYGESKEYGNMSTLDLKFSQDHDVLLDTLKNNTLYHFKVISQDDVGRIVESGDYTFVTLPQ